MVSKRSPVLGHSNGSSQKRRLNWHAIVMMNIVPDIFWGGHYAEERDTFLISNNNKSVYSIKTTYCFLKSEHSSQISTFGVAFTNGLILLCFDHHFCSFYFLEGKHPLCMQKDLSLIFSSQKIQSISLSLEGEKSLPAVGIRHY